MFSTKIMDYLSGSVARFGCIAIGLLGLFSLLLSSPANATILEIRATGVVTFVNGPNHGAFGTSDLVGADIIATYTVDTDLGFVAQSSSSFKSYRGRFLPSQRWIDSTIEISPVSGSPVIVSNAGPVNNPNWREDSMRVENDYDPCGPCSPNDSYKVGVDTRNNQGDIFGSLAIIRPPVAASFITSTEIDQEFEWTTSIGGFPQGTITHIVAGDRQTISYDIESYTVSRLTPPDVAPTADAGGDQSIRAGDTVFLDGSGSFDDNTPTESLVFSWGFASLPAGSQSTLFDADSATPWFVADLADSYVLQLVVTDELGQESAPAFVQVSADNLPPSAMAGEDVLVIVGSSVTLDGSGSSDPEGDPLTYDWMLSGPTGSIATLSGQSTQNPSFVPDVEGLYEITLDVSDFLGVGFPDSVLVNAASSGEYAEVQIVDSAQIVGNLPTGDVTTAGNQQALANFLSQATTAIQNDNPANAIKKLQAAIERTDGCTLRGAPDANGKGRDWITDCGAQIETYALLLSAIDALSP